MVACSCALGLLLEDKNAEFSDLKKIYHGSYVYSPCELTLNI
jgi:hypothetical protein